MAICPAGHTSESTDYCDTCGAPMGEQAVPGPAGPTTPGPDGAGIPAGPAADAPQPCPNCGSMNPHDALFCEACGYDYTTGTMPRAGAEAADLLSIDTPVAPAAQQAPQAPEAPQAPVEAQAPEGPVDAPAEDEGDQPSLLPDAGAAGTTPATDDEAHADASAEGMPEAPAEADAVEAAPADPASLHAPVPVHEAAPAPSEGKAPAEFVAEVWVDPDWYNVQQSGEAMPSPGLPEVVPLRGRQALIGRVSQSRNIHPEIDCGSDTGASRRQAQLSTDGQRWFVEDLESANGTYVGAMGQPLPQDPIQGRRELADDDRIYVGAWTRIVLRKATPDERAAFAG